MAHSFFGGVHPDDRKQLACDRPIGPYVPRQVVIPMSQHIGAPCQPLVKKGDTVTVGQKIGDNTGLCVPVHASVSGTVAAVELRPHTSGVPVMSVVIDSDGLDTPCPDLTPHETLDGLTAEELMDKAMELADAICANAPIAVAESKRCIRMGMQTDIATGAAFEAEAFGVCCGTEDKNEGMGAFLEKRAEKHFQNK